MSQVKIKMWLLLMAGAALMLLSATQTFALSPEETQSALKDIEAIAEDDPALAQQMKKELGTYIKEETQDEKAEEFFGNLNTAEGKQTAIAKITEDYQSGKSGLTAEEYQKVVEVLGKDIGPEQAEQELSEIFEGRADSF